MTLFFSSSSLSVGTTDTLVTVGGDLLIGEIKELERGKMFFDTDATGKIPVKWDHVLSLRSPRFCRVELSNGDIFFGSLKTDTSSGHLLITLGESRREAPLTDVVSISHIKRAFWDRLDISVSVGLTFQKGSEVGQSSLTGNVTDKRDWDLRMFNASFIITVQKEKDPTQRYDVSLQTNWHLGNRWFANGYGAYQRNTELGVSSRFILGGGGGRYLVYENNQYFFAVSGLFGSFERGRDSLGMPTNVRSLEGLVGIRYALFQYDKPEIDLETFLNIFPRLPKFDRVRLEFDVTLKWEIVKDLTWNLTFYNSFDSQPPSETAAKEDFGITFALGWTF